MRSMGRKGRTRGRALARIDKAMSHGAAVGFATANRGNTPRMVALGDAINAATVPGRSLVIDDETQRFVPMMRDPRDRTAFGPSNALDPAPIDPSRTDTKRPEPRLTEYPVSWNLPGSADQPVPWATLRAAAENVDIIRRCIGVRKEQLQGLDWSITLDDQLVQDQYAVSAGDTGREDIEAEIRRKMLPEIERLTTFWKNPWKANGVSFEQWCNGVMEDHLVLDGVAIYPRMTYGGELSAFELIDPTTIKLLIDYRGARPEPPYPAFQQVLYGFPRAEFGSCYVPDGEDGVKPAEGIEAGSLWYFREEYRSFTPYGFSAVQQALISARLYLRRQGWMLAEYDDGSTPLTFLVPDATDGTMVEKLTPRTRQQWEDSINAMYSGQTRQRHRMKVLQPGMQPIQMQGVDERYKPDYDMHLIKVLAMPFGVTSSGLGFSESKGLGNSGLHEGQADVQSAATTKPDKRMIERIVNELMQTYQGAPTELRFKFTDPDTEDKATEDAAANAQRARGTITLNDDRKRLGKSPFTFPEADQALVLVGTGWVPLEGMAARAEQAAEAEQALVEDQLATSEQGREIAASQAEAEELSGETAEKALELAAYRRWARKRGGDARRPFICKALEPGDFPGEQVPHDVDFAEWEWVPEALADTATDEMIMKFVGYDVYTGIEKAFGQGNDNWRTLARDHRGRWVKRGSMRVDALGPSTPDKPVLAGLARDAERRRAAAAPKRQLPVSDASSTMDGMTTPAPRTDMRPRAETYNGRKLKVSKGKEWGTLKLEINGEHAGTVSGGRPEDMDRHLAQLRRDVDAADLRRHDDPTAFPEHFYRGAPEPTEQQRADAAAYWARERADRAALNAPAEPPMPSRAERAAALNAGMAAAMSGRAPAKGSMAERIMARQDASVRDVVTSLADAPGGWVAMADVRRKLAAEHGMDRGQQDAALRRLATTGDRSLNTAPEDNQKTLTDADHAAAVDFGAGPQHIISLDPPRADDRVNIGDPASVQRWMDETGDYLAAAQAAREANPHVDAKGRRWIEGADGLWRDGNGAAVPSALLPAKSEPAQRSVLDTVRESSEQADSSVPGLREGVARQQGERLPTAHELANAGIASRGSTDTAPPMTGVDGIETVAGTPDKPGAPYRIDGNVARWFGGKREAQEAAVAIGWPKNSVYPVRTRFQDGWAIKQEHGGFLTRNAYAKLHADRSTSADDPELTTVREATPRRGYDIPATRDSRIAAALAEIPEVRQTTRGRGKQAREAFSAAGFLHDTREAAEAARRAEAERLVDREDRAAELDRAAIEAEGRNDAEGAALARADRAQMRYEDAQARTDHLGDLAETLDTDEARARHDAAIAESERLRAEADEAELAYNAAQRPRLRAEQDAADQRAREHLARINAEREAKERKAAEDAAAEVERKAREREENARRVAEIQAETRAELARRTPEAFALMLDGGDKATTHAPSRKILADMREQGWTMTHMNGSMMRFEAPDGRAIRMTYGKNRVKWQRGDYKGNQTMGEDISLPTAAALVADKPTPAARAEAIAASTPAAPSINDMMAQQMAASVANPSTFGGAYGKVTGDQVRKGMRVQFNGATWEVLETPRRAQRDNNGNEGKLFRARREDQGFEGTIRINEGKSIALAAPREQLKADDATFASIADRVRSAKTDDAARKQVNSLKREGLDGVARSMGIEPDGMKLAELRAAVLAARGGGA